MAVWLEGMLQYVFAFLLHLREKNVLSRTFSTGVSGRVSPEVETERV
jgi:hypothetical protein